MLRRRDFRGGFFLAIFRQFSRRLFDVCPTFSWAPHLEVSSG
jgi:hypothetical protein